MDPHDNQSALLVVAEKLVHPLAEVRRRAVKSLDFKLKHQLLTSGDLGKERAVLKNLLGCLKHEDNGLPTDAAVLMLLAKAASTPHASRQLLHLGAEELLSHTQQTRPPELQPTVAHTLAAVLAATASQPGPAPSAGFGRPLVTPSSVRGMPGGGWAQQALPGASANHGALARHGHGTGSPVRATLLPQSAPTPAFTYSAPRPVDSGQQTPRVVMRAPVDATLGTSAAQRGSGHRSMASGGLGWPRQTPGREGGVPITATIRDGDWLLQPVTLGQADDQHLFELSVRLKYVEDPRIVLPALLQLHGTSLVDLPVEAVVARHDIVDHLLVLLASSSSPLEVAMLAAKSLLRIVTQLKRALLLATDPMYATGSDAAWGTGVVAGDGPGSPSRSGALGGLGSPLTHQGPAAGVGYLVSEGAEQWQQLEAQRLLPQPLPVAPGVDRPVAYGAGGQGGLDQPVNVSILAYLIALKAFQVLRDPSRLFAIAPVVEELVPLLVLGREGLTAVAEERDRVKWTQLFQVLSHALVANLSIARAESPPIVQAAAAASGASGAPLLPVLNAPSAALLALAARLLAALPPDLWTPDVVPASLLDTLAAVARDDVLSDLLPGLRPALLPPLAVLRPDVATVLDLAAAGEAALAAGATLVGQLAFLRTGQLSPDAWLRQLQLALPALHLPEQEGLLEGAMQGLAMICSRPAQHSGHGNIDAKLNYGLSIAAAPDAKDGGGGRWVQEAEDVFLQLLSHPTPAVAMACYGLLENLLHEVKAQAGHPLLRLLTRKAVLERLVTLGQADERTRRQVARILMNILPDAACQSCMLPWATWIGLYESDTQVGVLSAALSAAARVGMALPPPEEGSSWLSLQPVLIGLFSADGERRKDAARQLVEALQASGMAVANSDEAYLADPLRVCLDGGARDDLVVPAANPRLARTFRAADVTNLLAILGNSELALELRRSAAEQMLALAAEERLREVMVEQDNLRLIVCVAALRDPSTGSVLSASQAGTRASQGLQPPTPDLLSTLDVQLPLAAINLLFVLAACSPSVRAWLATGTGTAPVLSSDTWPNKPNAGASGGLEMLVHGILPLVFHSMVTVRRAVARLLAALCFGGEADRWSGWTVLARHVAVHAAAASAGDGKAGGAASSGRTAGASGRGPAAPGGDGGGTSRAGDVLVLPEPFQRSYRLPCRVTWVALPALCSTREEPGATLEGLPKLQDLVSEQRELVVLLIQERKALRAAEGEPTRLLTLMNERPDCVGRISQGTLHTIAANIRAVAPDDLVPRCLAAVRSATSHAECTAALRGLQAVCSTRQGIVALANADWQGHFGALLSTVPTSPEDRALWVELLEPVRRVLLSGALSQAQLLQLSHHLQHSARQVLCAPDAYAEPPSVPVALAGSDALLELPSGAVGVTLCTQSVLALLVDLVRCARTHLPVQQSLQVAMALSPAQLLQALGGSYIGNTAASYGCRALAVQLLLELAALLATAQETEMVTVSALDSGLQEAMLLCLRSLLQSVSGGFAAGAAASPVLAGISGGDAGSAAERSRQLHAGGFAGKGAVRLAIHCLLHLTALLPLAEWAPAWQQLSGSFWVSRLLRDRDSVLRSLAGEVLARLMQPGADHMHAMVTQGWPDAVRTMAKAACDRTQCCALRTAALRVLGCVMAQDAHQAPGVQVSDADGASEGPLPRRQLFSSTTSLPPAALLLQNGSLWAQLPRMLQEPDAPASFLASVLTLLLQGLLLDGERVAGLLSQPGLADRLFQLVALHLSPRSATDAAGVGHRGGAGGPDRAAVLGLLYWQQGGPAVARSKDDGGAGARGGVGAELTAQMWADPTTTLQAESCPGLDMQAVVVTKPEAGGHPPDPARASQHLHLLRCAGLVAEILAHTHQDPPLLQLPLLGHSLTECTSALLALCARLAPSVAATDAARGLYTGVQAAEAGVRLEVATQAATAANAMLQLLDEDSAHQALLAVDQARERASGPLMCRCGDVLLARCSPRSLRMAVVCLVATALARQDTAAGLLRPSAEGGEHLIPGTGREVGAGLCSALIELLPDDALLPDTGIQGPPTDMDAAPHAPHPHTRASTCSLRGAGSYSRATPAQRGHGGAAIPSGKGHLTDGNAKELAASPAGVTLTSGKHYSHSDQLCVIVSLRNLLAYSSSAKQEALRSGFHCVLLQACSRGASLLAAAVPATKQHQHQQPGAAGQSHGEERRSTQSLHGPGAGPSAAKKLAALRGARKAGPVTRESTPAPASARASGNRPTSHQRNGHAAADTAQEQQHNLPSAEATEPAVPTPIPASSPVRGGVARGGQASEQRAASRRTVELKAVASLSLLRHLAHASALTRQALVADGIVALLRVLWPLAAASTSGPLFHELLSCLTNLLPGCPEARLRVAQEGASTGGRGGGGGTEGVASGGAEAVGTILGRLLACVFESHRLEAPTFSLAVGVLRQLSATEDGTQLLLKSPFLSMCQKALQDAGSGTGGSARAAREGPRHASFLQVLTSVAAWPEGQRALLRSSSGPGLLELVVRLLPSPGSHDSATGAWIGTPPQSLGAGHGQPVPGGQQAELRNAALGLVRNLCFASEAKAHLLAHPGVLPALVAAAEDMTSNPQGAAYAASALWALSYHGEKVKAALRRVPSAVQRLVTAHATCLFLADRMKTKPARPRPAEQEPRGETTFADESAFASTAADWTDMAKVQLSGVLQALQGTCTGAERADGGALGWGTPKRDRSPLRDQNLFAWRSHME